MGDECGGEPPSKYSKALWYANKIACEGSLLVLQSEKLMLRLEYGAEHGTDQKSLSPQSLPLQAPNVAISHHADFYTHDNPRSDKPPPPQPPQLPLEGHTCASAMLVQCIRPHSWGPTLKTLCATMLVSQHVQSHPHSSAILVLRPRRETIIFF